MSAPTGRRSAPTRQPPMWDARPAGLAMGILETFAMATAKRPLGVTSAIETAATATARAVAPGATQVNRFLVERDAARVIDWEAALVPGIALGSHLSARLAGQPSPPAVPARWERRFGPSRVKRNAAAFVGGALMIFGARLAKGCTSGHGISGNMQLAASSALFSVTMATTAAVVARLLLGGAR